MNNTKKWLIGIGVVGVLCVAACGITLLVLRQAGRQIGQSFKTDATGVAEVSARIADFDLPPGYVQLTGTSLLIYDFVIYEPANKQPGMSIMMMQFGGTTAYSSEQMQRALEQQSGRGNAGMKVVSSYQTTIRGQTSTVVIEEGGASSQEAAVVRQLFTTFPGRHGTVMLMIDNSKDLWDQDAVDQFIASIR